MSPCCEQPENRETLERRGDLIVQKCKVCGRKHYELTLDPVEVGVKGKGM
jgi:hypothetical protein